MKINSITIQTQPALVAFAEAGTRATSSGSVDRTKDAADRKGSPSVQDEKLSADISQPIGAEDLGKELKKLNDQMEFMNRSIQFSIDDESDNVVVKIIDKSSGEVISQIPPEEILKLRERMREMAGLLVEKTV